MATFADRAQQGAIDHVRAVRVLLDLGRHHLQGLRELLGGVVAGEPAGVAEAVGDHRVRGGRRDRGLSRERERRQGSDGPEQGDSQLAAGVHSGKLMRTGAGPAPTGLPAPWPRAR